MIIGVLFALHGYAQTNTVKVTTKYPENRDLIYLLRFHGIDFIKNEFTGENLQGKYFTLRCKNIWNGEITKIDTIVSSELFKSIGWRQIPFDTLSLNLLGSKVGDSLKVDFNFTFSTVKKYKAADSDFYSRYSLRPVMRENVIELNKFTPVFVYMLPYVQGNARMYCAVEQSGHDIEAWGKQFNIEHYMIFEIMFEE